MRYRKWIAASALIALMQLIGGMSAHATRDGSTDFRAPPLPPAEVQLRQDGGWLVAQATDPRVMALEEQVRSLSGQVEELNFLLLQLQEHLRKMQEDNEYRFQQMEGGAATIAPQQRSEAPASQPQELTREAPSTGQSAAQAGATPDGSLAEPPRNLGAIVLNPDGSVKDVTLGEPMDLRGAAEPQAPSGAGAPTDDTTVAALPDSNDPELLYGNSYEFILSGDYRTAEAGFRRHVEQFPNDPRTTDARYWLGESLLSQGRYAEAAEVFLSTSREFPDARKAPDMLLKLGVSLAAMDQKEVACATFREVESRYPDASGALRDRVRQEAALAGC